MAQQMVALAPGDDDFSDVLPCLVDVSNIDEMPLGVGDVFYGTTTMRSASLPPVDHVEHERVSCTTPPQPPEVRHLPMAARNSVMTAWLVEHDIAFDEGRAGVKEAWKRVQARCRDAARRKCAHDARDASCSAQPLATSVARMARKRRADETAEHTLQALSELMGEDYVERRCLPRRSPEGLTGYKGRRYQAGTLHHHLHGTLFQSNHDRS